MKVKPGLIILLIYLLVTGCFQAVAAGEDQFLKGADISFLPKLEDHGVEFYNLEGEQEDLLTILNKHGINTIRLRLWVNNNNYCNLTKTLAFAQRIKQAGFKLLLDFHYSDTWADPGQQKKPKRWQDLSPSELEEKVYNYTKKVVQALKQQETAPDLVQIGNEINNGLLWPTGKISKHGWAQAADLIKSGIQGVKDGLGGERAEIIIHIAGFKGADWFYQHLIKQDVKFDIMGLSYYPWWHGKDLSALSAALNKLSKKYDKDILIVETAYPWTLKWDDWTNNIVGEKDQLLVKYPASVKGQRRYLTDLIQLVKEIPTDRGRGVIYWAPEYVAFNGKKSKNGSPWENLALFNFGNQVLKSIISFQKAAD